MGIDHFVWYLLNHKLESHCSAEQQRKNLVEVASCFFTNKLSSYASENIRIRYAPQKEKIKIVMINVVSLLEFHLIKNKSESERGRIHFVGVKKNSERETKNRTVHFNSK